VELLSDVPPSLLGATSSSADAEVELKNWVAIARAGLNARDTIKRLRQRLDKCEKFPAKSVLPSKTNQEANCKAGVQSASNIIL
jgi:hypothetical protein